MARGGLPFGTAKCKPERVFGIVREGAPEVPHCSGATEATLGDAVEAQDDMEVVTRLDAFDDINQDSDYESDGEEGGEQSDDAE